jgi:flagellar capping protein FliD
MTMSLSTGLISGMDTGSLISQLIQAEAAPQAALKARLKTTELAAAAYRTVNTSFLAVKAAAEAIRKTESWTPVKATSTSTGVTVTAGAAAPTGSLTFTVPQTATTHATVSTTRWASSTAVPGLTTLDVRTHDGTASKGTITLDGTETLTQVAAKITASPLNLTASVVQVEPGKFALQVTSTKSGKDAGFRLTDGVEVFTDTVVGKDAELRVGDAAGAYSVFSATNTFDGVVPGATLTVSRKETDFVTVAVAADPDSVAAKVSSLVDAINSTLSTVKKETNNAPGSKATLRGEYGVTSLAGRLLEAVSDSVADALGKNRSPADVGIQLTKEGTVVFDKAKFLTALENTPALAQRIVAGSAEYTTKPDGTRVPVVPGIADRLQEVTKAASDSAKGSLVGLANGQDSMGRDIKNRIESWDLRLAKRREILTRQFTAMETSLSSLRNQSTWLAGQINSLPS